MNIRAARAALSFGGCVERLYRREVQPQLVLAGQLKRAVAVQLRPLKAAFREPREYLLRVGLMAREGDFLRLTQRGMQVMNSVLVDLL